MGWTHISDGIVLPFTDVDCDRIRGFVQTRLARIDANGREEVFGRAIGRVLAPELYHIFAHTTQHGAGGVGKAFYSVEELTAEVFRFAAAEFSALRTSHARMLLETNEIVGVHGASPEAAAINIRRKKPRKNEPPAEQEE